MKLNKIKIKKIFCIVGLLSCAMGTSLYSTYEQPNESLPERQVAEVGSDDGGLEAFARFGYESLDVRSGIQEAYASYQPEVELAWRGAFLGLWSTFPQESKPSGDFELSLGLDLGYLNARNANSSQEPGKAKESHRYLEAALDLVWMPKETIGFSVGPRYAVNSNDKVDNIRERQQNFWWGAAVEMTF